MAESKIELNKHRLLLPLLQQLELHLRVQHLWQNSKPSQQALMSKEPFALDTLTFAQWLQFIFLEKMHELIQFSQPLPNSISVHPMATEYFKGFAHDYSEIENIIARIDLLLNQ